MIVWIEPYGNGYQAHMIWLHESMRPELIIHGTGVGTGNTPEKALENLTIGDSLLQQLSNSKQEERT